MAAVSFVNKTPSRSLLAGNTGFGTSFEWISSITVGSLGASSVSFTEIPQGYRHLQIRSVGRTNRGTYAIDDLKITFNNDTGNNYAWHGLYGTGTAAGSIATTSTSGIVAYSTFGTTVATNLWGPSIVDILDYSNTTKNKTVRILGGTDSNNTGTVPGYIGLYSGLWMSTAAINSLTIVSNQAAIFQQHSTFSLYGIR